MGAKNNRKNKGEKERLWGKVRRLIGYGDKSSDSFAAADPEFISRCGPSGGITFSSPRHIASGSGYEAVLSVTEYPRNVWARWLAALMDIEEAVTVIDIGTKDTAAALKSISHSMEEQEGRADASNATRSERQKAEMQLDELLILHQELIAMGEVMKQILCRIYIPEHAVSAVDEKVAKIRKGLGAAGFKSSVFLAEGKSDYRAVFTPLAQQMNTIYKRSDQPILASTIAEGSAFHSVSVMDPFGKYYGTTSTGGSAYIDWSHKTTARMSYCGLLAGMMGSGKSTFLKLMLKDRAVRGDLVRVFDVVGDFRDLILHLGGKVIALDGQSGNTINVLQIMRTSDNPAINYNLHISKVATFYRYLKPEAKMDEVFLVENILKELYEKFGILSPADRDYSGLTELPAHSYPRWSDYLLHLKEKVACLDRDGRRGEYEYNFYKSIELTVANLVDNYGNIFDVHTSIPNLYSEPVLSFDLTSLTGMKSEIFDAQYFNVQTLSWANCLSSGMEQKRRFDSGEIGMEDVRMFWLYFDELHKTVNASKTVGIDLLSQFMRESRKYFGGLWFATQNMRDFFPESSTGANVEKIKTLFELTTYKIVMRQNDSVKPLMRSIFAGTFTEYDIERVSLLGTGEAIVSIPGEGNVLLSVEITDEERRIFAGGA